MKIVDSHVHLRSSADVQQLNANRERIGAERMSIASLMDVKRVTDNAAAYAAKAAFPDRFYVFGALDHATVFSSGKIKTPSFVEQLDSMIATGIDGIKMLESKPTHRLMADFPIDGDYYAGFFARLEEAGLPVLFHVADPEEFWDPATTPSFARQHGWGYDSTWAPKEGYYAEVENVLKRHPRLKVTFAHFYFMSADLPRAERLLDQYTDVRLDLAPGIEMLYNMSKDPERAREFFIRHADRIVFGTDIEGYSTLDEAEKRAGIVRRWLESEDEFRLPEGADYTLGSRDDGIIRGMRLPKDALQKIYATNFEGLVGPQPKPLNKSLAIEECKRTAAELEALGGDPVTILKAIEILG